MHPRTNLHLCIILALLITQTSLAQTPSLDWAKRIGAGSGSDVGYAISTDAAGNVYTAGTFDGTVDFNPGTGIFNLTSAGALDIFITKLDPSGNFVWAKQMGGISNDFVWDLHLDAAGNIYTAGYFFTTADFDPGTGNANLTVAGSSDGFISKLDPSGNFVWVKQVGGTSSDRIEAMALQGSTLAFTGTFFGTGDFDPGAGTATLTSAGSEEVFVVSLDLNGDFIWAGKLGGVGSDQGRAISIDATGNVYATGIFNGTSDFDPGAGTTNLTATGTFDAFIAKLTSTGTFAWAKRIGGSGITTPLIAYSNTTGFVQISGTFELTADLDPGSPNVDVTSNGNTDVFLVNLDASGNYVWSKTWGSTGFDSAYGLVTDITGNFFIAGGFQNTVDFDPGAGTANLTSAGSTEIYVSKLDPSGNYLWAGRMGGANVDLARAITVDVSGNILTTGLFRSTADFDPGTGTFNLTSASSTEDVFIQKLNPTSAPVITSFSPLSGPVGNTVTISGERFSPTAANNVVHFGGTRATVTAATANQLSVSVPAGAAYDRISVMVNGLSAISNDFFILNFGCSQTLDATSFAPKIDFGAGVDPYAMAQGDFDQDGKPDLVAAVYGANTVSTFRNTSTGPGNIAFAPKQDISMGTGRPYAVTTGDFDGDGKLDFAIAAEFINTVSVFRNTSSGPGNISFAARVDFPSGAFPHGITAGDFNNDGRTDLAVTSNNLDVVSVYANTSTGTGTISFAARVDFATGSAAEHVANADLDGDGRADLVVTNYSGLNISVLRNTSVSGSISFAPKSDLAAGNTPNFVSVGDIDLDGKLDLAVANAVSETISVYRNTSTPGIITLAPKVDFPVQGSFTVALGDVSGDGKIDLVVPDFGTDVFVGQNTSTGPGNLNVGSPVGFTVGSAAQFASVGDFDLDGKADIAVVNQTSQSISVLRNLVPTPPPPTISGFSPGSGAVGTSVTITGTNFDPIPSNNTVTFNGVTATVTSATTNNLQVTVPAGATTGKITVTVGCNTVTSAGDFTVGGSCVPAAQRAALVALYNSTDGANWTDNTGWLSPDESTWYGITVTGCDITGIALDGNNLVGTIPPELGDLITLETLEMGVNQLSGPIPPELGNLSNLIDLNLAVNQLDGAVPVEISYLSNLQALALSNNMLSGNLPIDLQNLSSLQFAFLGFNQFTGDLPAIGLSSPAMSMLQAQFNQFTGVPDFTAYTAISSINVVNNRLTFDDLEPYMGVAGLTYAPQAMIPPGGIISFVVGGTLTIPFSTGGTANSYQWLKGGVPIPGATSATLSIPGATAADVGFYSVQITNSIVPLLTLSSMSYNVITDPCPPSTRTAGDLDASFAPLISVPSYFYDVAVQSTGKIITSTSYTIENSIVTSGMMRFNSNGSRDNSFVSNPHDGLFLVLPDDRIIATYADGIYTYPIRLDANGNEDAAFNANVSQYYSGNISALARQPNGKILVAATAYLVPPFVERFNTDGTSDGVLADANGLDLYVIEVQSDGYILLGGAFPGGIIRLDPTGVVDPTFSTTGASDFVNDIAIQSDGKILVAGNFSFFNDLPHNAIVRLNPNGSIDNTFTALGITNLIESGFSIRKIALQTDGKIILAGEFESINGTQRKNLVRLNSDGTVDCGFNPEGGADMGIGGLALQTDGQILISGSFDSYDGTTRHGLARVNAGITGVLTPIISGFSPATGPVGTTVTITGANFSTIAANNIVYFGATQATVTGATATQLTVTVPMGATFQPISVMVSGLTGYSSKPFVVTFPNGGSLADCAFSPPVTFASDLTDWIPGIAISDIDGDGKPDIAVTNNATNSFSVFRNTATPGAINAGSFAAAVNYTTGNAPRGIAVGDLDGDGKPDVVVTNHQAHTLSVFRNTSTSGTITAASFAPKVDFATPFFPNDVLLADLDADGKPEMISVNIGGNSVSIFRNISTTGSIDAASFAAKVDLSTGAGASPYVAAIGDLDNDAKPDIVVSNSNGNSLSIFRNISVSGSITAGSFAAKVDFATPSPDDVQIADVDGDGKPDIAVADWLSTTVSVFRNISSTGVINSGSFSPKVSFTTLPTPERINFADMDGDGKVDLTVSTQNDGVSILRNTSTPGAITAGSLAAHTDLAAVNTPDYSAVGDLDGDGRPDIVLANYTDNTIAVYQNTTSSLVPAITSFTPTSGAAGTAVTLTGSDFSPVPSDNLVSFNGAPAVVSSSTASTINTTVPAGATSGPITVTVGCNTGTSAGSFSSGGLTITLQPSDVIVCDGSTGIFTTSATGTTNITYKWQFSPDGVVPFADIADGGGYSGTATASLSVNTTGTFGEGRYRCRINGDFSTEVVTNDEGLFINSLPSPPTTTGASSCGSASVTLTAAGTTNGNYRWYTVSSGGTAISGEVNATYATPVIASTTTYYVSIHNGTCESGTRTPVTATINSLPGAPGATGNSSCVPAALTLTATGGSPGEYRWYTVATGGTAIPGEVNNTYLTPVLATTTTYHVALNDGTCESLRTPVTGTVEVVAKPAIVTSNCTATGATLTGPAGFAAYAWSTGATTQQIAVTTAGSYALVVTSAGGCLSPASDAVSFTSAFCNQPPALQPTPVTTTVQSTVTVNVSAMASDLDNNLDPSSLKVITQPTSGANAFVNANFELVVDYSGITFAGTDQLTIELCDVAGACVQEILTIEVAGDITIYNALSPNGDGKNDVFFIEYINALPETQQNKVTILNRWGSVVFETTNYDNTNNVFRGLSDSGAELPSGTYYYILEFASGAPKRTGFISLRK